MQTWLKIIIYILFMLSEFDQAHVHFCICIFNILLTKNYYYLYLCQPDFKKYYSYFIYAGVTLNLLLLSFNYLR